jgi:hypothetical protein
METPDSPKTLRTPILLFVACVLLLPTLGLTACAEPTSSSASSTPVQADATATLPDAILTPVVGTFYLVKERYTPARTKLGDLEQIRDEDWVLRYEMSDPRLSGDQDTIINGDLRADGSAELWGTAVISNDLGTWECSKWTGTIAEGGLEHYIWAVYKGTGAYAGLTYYQQNHFVELPGAGKPPTEGVAATGWIQETK